MNRTRIKIAVFVDLDPVPGTFHSAESARKVIDYSLQSIIGHYNPATVIESYDTNPSDASEITEQ
jgi:hypothetical protein